MWGNLYAWEKIRKLETELDFARTRHAPDSRELRRLTAPWGARALSWLASAMRRGDRAGAGSDPKAGQPALDTLVEIRGGR